MDKLKRIILLSEELKKLREENLKDFECMGSSEVVNIEGLGLCTVGYIFPSILEREMNEKFDKILEDLKKRKW